MPTTWVYAAQRGDIIYNQSIGQSPGERVTIEINMGAFGNDTNYEVQLLNAAGDVIGGGLATASGGGHITSFGPFCGVDQTSKNIESIRILNYWGDEMNLNGVNFVRTSDADVQGDTSGTSAGAAQEAASGQTLYGALSEAGPDDPDNGKYWNIHLERGQTLLTSGWATSESVSRGAAFFVELQTPGGSTWNTINSVAPYGTKALGLGRYKAPESGTYRVRARTATWKVCKFAIHLSVEGVRSPPPHSDPCSTDQGSTHLPVELFDGRERSNFAPDLVVYNPVGAPVSFQRSWREVLALLKNGTPGLQRGWTHSYDFYLNSWGTGDLQLNYPGGGRETLTAGVNTSGALDGTLSAPKGAPYRISGVPSTDTTEAGDGCCGTGSQAPNTHQWQNVNVTWDDGSVWQFVPTKRRYLYRIERITSPTGQWLQLAYDEVNEKFGRLTTIKNQVGTTLLTLSYTGRNLTSLTDVYGRKVAYEWTSPSGIDEDVLASVSQPYVGTPATIPSLQTFGYENFGARPLLRRISNVNPNGGTTLVSAFNTYDSKARVSSTTDTNGNKHLYTYDPNGPDASGESQTVVTVQNSAGVTLQSWTMVQNANGFNAGYINASGQRWKIYYDDVNNPLKPTRWIDPLNRTSTANYDAFGHVTRAINARGVSQVATWNYSAWPLGRLTQIQTSTTTASLLPTTFAYQEPSGLLLSATSPHPNGSGTVTVSATYDSYGNPTQITTPGNASTPTRTTQFAYTQDGTYTQPMAVGRPVAIMDSSGAVTHLRYDIHYNLYSSTDASGATTTTLHDDYDRPIITQLPATGQTGGGRGEIRYFYGYRGGPPVRSEIYNEAGAVTRTFNRYYGNEGELKNSFGNALAESYEYDALYRVKTFIDGAGYRTNYSYDSDGRLRETTYPNGTPGGTNAYDRTRITAYDASGLPLQQIDGRGVVTNLTYNDPEGRLTSVEYPAATSENVALSYDGFGRLAQRSDSAGRENFVYTAANTIRSQITTYKKANNSDMAGWTKSMFYNADGSRERLSTPLGDLSYNYDAAGRLNGLSGIDNKATTWSYLANGWLSSQKTPNRIQTNYFHNSLGQVIAQGSARMTDMTGDDVSETLSTWGSTIYDSQSQLYNASGQLERAVAFNTRTSPLEGTTHYSYDGRGQLSSEINTRGAGYNHSFAYDGAGNATTWKGQTRTFNANNQETTGGAFGYNGDGSPWKYLNRNLASSTKPNGEGQVFSYNVRGQLQQVNATNADGTTGNVIAQYLYRSDGKRAWKQGNNSTGRVYFFYDGDLLLGMSREDGTDTSVMLWGADGLIGQQWYDNNNIVCGSYFVYDPNGNLTHTTDEHSYVREDASETLAWTAWGEVVPRADGTKPGVGTWGYGAKYGYFRDGETGFYLATYRHYDPGAGRWLTRDPIEYAGGQNLYGYVNNDPANMTDPSGLVGVQFGGSDSPIGIGYGEPTFILDASDLEEGRRYSVDTLNPFGDPWGDNGGYNGNDSVFTGTRVLTYVAAAAGAAAGGLAVEPYAMIALSHPVGAGAFFGGAGGAVENVAQGYMSSNGDYTLRNGARDAIGGFIGGMPGGALGGAVANPWLGIPASGIGGFLGGAAMRWLVPDSYVPTPNASLGRPMGKPIGIPSGC